MLSLLQPLLQFHSRICSLISWFILCGVERFALCHLWFVVCILFYVQIQKKNAENTLPKLNWMMWLFFFLFSWVVCMSIWFLHVYKCVCIFYPHNNALHYYRLTEHHLSWKNWCLESVLTKTIIEEEKKTIQHTHSLFIFFKKTDINIWYIKKPAPRKQVQAEKKKYFGQTREQQQLSLFANMPLCTHTHLLRKKKHEYQRNFHKILLFFGQTAFFWQWIIFYSNNIEKDNENYFFFLSLGSNYSIHFISFTLME